MLLLFGLCFVQFAATHAHGFLSFDDPDYVTQNPMVLDGLSGSSVRWAFTQTHSSNWHPLTWLSHMLDVQLFGLQAGKHHLVSAAWHSLNAALCLAFLVRMNARLGPSLLAAGLFALHPQRAESVAWISERKDLLAGSFFFLTLLAHLAYVARPSSLRRWSVALAFSLGLLCKPSVIMLPLLLIWIDRVGGLSQARRPAAELGLWFQLREKAPLLVLALASALVTLLVQGESGAVSQEAALGALARVSNALSSTGAYLLSAVWPLELSYFYPHPALSQPDWSPWNAQAGLSMLALGALGLWAWRIRRQRPAALLGLGWFLIVLLPMTGLVQVGEQARADRYTYLSSLGLYMGLALGLDWRFLGSKLRWILGTLVLLLCSLLGRQELMHWKDSLTLYTRGYEVTERNYVAALAIANLRNNAGDLREAADWYELVLATRPEHVQALYSYGLLEQKRGRVLAAESLYRRALAAAPDHTPSRLNLAALLAAGGRLHAAIEDFGVVVRQEPKGSPPRRLAAENLSAMGREFQTQLQSNPKDPELEALLQAVQAALYPGG